MNSAAFLTLLQFADGLFPAGAFAHSFGLETFVQSGGVDGEPSVLEFLESYLEGSCAPADCAAAVRAWQASAEDDLASSLTLDEILEAMKPARELREASRQMGRQTLRVAAHLAPDQLLAHFSAAVEENITPGHHAVVFGVVGHRFGWPREEMARAFLYSTSAALVGAALRLLPLGQLAGQRILWSVQPLIARLAAEAHEEMWSFAPAQEIAAMRHARLEARLFRS